MIDKIRQSAEKIAASKKTVSLTGAGISVESGIPPFRGQGSIWEKIDPMEFAHIQSFLRNPEKVWTGFLSGMKDILDKARPNEGHKGLAELESMGLLTTIITQNIDGLHQMAGNTDVIEFHGNFAWQRCMKCHKTLPSAEVDLAVLPPLCRCGGLLRPDCVFFGEMIPEDSLVRSRKLAETCDVMIVVGTSAVVQPAAMIPVLASRNGAFIIEINPAPTPLTHEISDFHIQGSAGKVISELVAAVKDLL